MFVTLPVHQLWDAIYASRNAEKYWKQRRRNLTEGAGADHYTHEELCDEINKQREVTKALEALAPADSW